MDETGQVGELWRAGLLASLTFNMQRLLTKNGIPVYTPCLEEVAASESLPPGFFWPIKRDLWKPMMFHQDAIKRHSMTAVCDVQQHDLSRFILAQGPIFELEVPVLLCPIRHMKKWPFYSNHALANKHTMGGSRQSPCCGTA